MVNLDGLKRLTQELAEEVKYDEKGPLFKLVTLILNNIKSFAAILDDEKRLIWANKMSVKRANKFGIDLVNSYGKKCEKFEICSGKCKKCPIAKVIKQRKILTNDFKAKLSGKSFTMICIPLLYNGVSGVIVLMGDSNVR